MASRAVDLLITYRIMKLLVTPFDKQEAFKYGIIDKQGKVLKIHRNIFVPVGRSNLKSPDRCHLL